MKRYLLFMGTVYYPLGGMEDFVNDFDTLEQANKAARIEEKKYPPQRNGNEWTRDYVWWQIYDTEKRETVYE